MKTGKIVYQGKSKSGKDFVVRYPNAGDLESIWRYINTISKEQTFITYQGEKITLADEKKWLEGELKKINEGKAIQLFILSGDKIVGVSGVSMKERAEKHTGIFGITLARDFRGEGVGTILMEKVLHEVKINLKDLSIIILTMFANNKVAKRLYKKMGFKQYGKLPKGLFRKGEFVDQLYLYKEV